MLLYDVQTMGQVRAAILAAAQPTFEEARKNPVTITMGSLRYNFPDGIQQRRAEKLAAKINKVCK